jgi:hypothetical protein
MANVTGGMLIMTDTFGSLPLDDLAFFDGRGPKGRLDRLTTPAIDQAAGPAAPEDKVGRES